jgi:formylmethanofuran dehydrogenase subunit E
MNNLQRSGTLHLNQKSLDQLLEESSALHRHLCPRQVLGARTGMLAGQILEMALPQQEKRLLTIVESDGCYADGVSVATNCWVGRRTLRVEDYGKTAATFVDTETGRAIRILPSPESRILAPDYALEASNRWESMLLGYQRMPDEELFVVQEVALLTPVTEIISRPGIRANCDRCGEEIINEREILVEGRVLCRSCAGFSYYQPLPPAVTCL